MLTREQALFVAERLEADAKASLAAAKYLREVVEKGPLPLEDSLRQGTAFPGEIKYHGC